MYKLICILFISVSINGCNSIDGARQHFKQTRDYDVGRLIQNIPLASPIEVVQSDSGYREHHYAFYNAKTKSDCSWVYFIDDISEKVKSWKYTSDAKACFKSVRLGTPW